MAVDDAGMRPEDLEAALARPVEAVLLVDLRHMRSLGRMFGWDPVPDELVHLPFSSRATLLNETTYPTG